MNIAPYSLGIGDRFARPGEAQLIAFRIAAELGAEYTDALAANKAGIGRRVTENLRDRRLHRIFS